MKATIKDIAKEADVSITTVSFVLNGKTKNISETTIKKVKEIADKYNYIPNALAASLVTKKTKIIGLIIPDIQNFFFSHFAKKLEMELSKSGYNTILCNTDDKFEREKKSIEILLSRNVDALVLSPAIDSLSKAHRDELYKMLEESNIPFLIVDRDLGKKGYSKVLNDNKYGGYIATKHLIENNHKKIGCITGPLLDANGAKKRLEGYKIAIQEAGIEYKEDYVKEGNYDYESGYKVAKNLLNTDISAIFVCNDLMAYGVYQACQEKGLRIPEDISIVGFDDLYFSRILNVPLTTVNQDIESITKQTTSFILEKIKSDKLITKTYISKPSLTIRKSVKDLND